MTTHAPKTGDAMLAAVASLDTLAVLAGIPDPGSTVELDPEDLADTYPTGENLARGTWPADLALRRVAAWANALVAALPARQE